MMLSSLLKWTWQSTAPIFNKFRQFLKRWKSGFFTRILPGLRHSHTVFEPGLPGANIDATWNRCCKISNFVRSFLIKNGYYYSRQSVLRLPSKWYRTGLIWLAIEAFKPYRLRTVWFLRVHLVINLTIRLWSGSWMKFMPTSRLRYLRLTCRSRVNMAICLCRRPVLWILPDLLTTFDL